MPLDRNDLPRRAELERALLHRSRGYRGIPVLPRPKGEFRAPAAVSQEGMWQRIERSPGPALGIVNGLRLIGQVDTAALERAWNAVIARHETLRTALVVEGGRLIQVVAESVEVELPVSELNSAEFDRVTAEEVDLPFPLDHRPLARLRLFRTGPDEHLALLMLHHIIGEARSLEVLFRDVAAYYMADVTGTPAALPPLPVQWADFAAWHRARLAGSWGAELLAYWTRRLAGAVPAALPSDRSPGADRSQRGGMVIATVPDELYRRLVEVARAHRTTLYVVGMAAFTVLLARYSGESEIALNAPISYRNRAELSDLIADFSGDIIVRSDLSGNPGFAGLIDSVAEAVVHDFAYPDLPPHLLEPHLDQTDLIERIAAVQFTAERELDVVVDLAGVRTERVIPYRQYVLRPLSVRFRFDDHRAMCLVRYRSNLFSRARIDELVAGYLALLDEMVTHPRRRIFDHQLRR